MGITVTVKAEPKGFQHEGRHFETGNVHDMDEVYPEKSEHERRAIAEFWHDAGWVSCEEFGDDKPQDSSKRITLDIQKVTVGVKDTRRKKG